VPDDVGTQRTREDNEDDREATKSMTRDGKGITRRPVTSIGHELGHSLLGLYDPFNIAFENHFREYDRRDYYRDKLELPDIEKNTSGNIEQTGTDWQVNPDAIGWIELKRQSNLHIKKFGATWNPCCP